MKRHLVWFRNDLRVDDHPALSHACASKDDAVVAIYFYCAKQFAAHDVGSNQQYLIQKALSNLSQSLEQLNIKLIILTSDDFASSIDRLSQVIDDLAITDLHLNIEYAYNERQRDKQACQVLSNKTNCHRYVADSLVAPWDVLSKQGTPFKVFTPFSKAVYEAMDKSPNHPLSMPTARAKENLNAFQTVSNSDLDEVKPTAKFCPDISENNVHKQLADFVDDSILDYKKDRDFPAIPGTSQISPALAIGSVSIRRCYEFARAKRGEGAKTWIKELIWRDFYRSVMWHFPYVARGQAFLPVDKKIHWNRSEDDFEKWCAGNTGVPIVDSAMRQLLTTGWMHNRLRMVVASFLCKNLWIDWRWGERFFAQHLYDFDYASNNGGWQWSASIGTDAAPYFRVFNPVSQAERFDPDAEFIRKWIEPLQSLPSKAIHQFEQKPLPNYPSCMVDIKDSRKKAIEQFKVAKESEDD